MSPQAVLDPCMHTYTPAHTKQIHKNVIRMWEELKTQSRNKHTRQIDEERLGELT